ncbi:hypothetical protein RZS08_37515, partial [Arthrospira platensis SPKY1]|nr:hypothetical protein [Arthrospira platensis SPKY1]
MKTLQTSAIIIIAGILLASCGSNPEARLERLKAEREKLNNQIAQLESVANSNNNGYQTRATSVKVEPARNNEFRHYIEVQ